MKTTTVRQPHSDIQIQEFFHKIGLTELWPYIRANILGDAKMFTFVLVVSLIVFWMGHKYDSLFIEVLSGFIFITTIILKVMII